LFPLEENGGTIDWAATMSLLRSSPGQYPLVLELKEVPDLQYPIRKAQTVFERLEELRSHHES
jgi:sugar phosphate isomerase/epimerase